MSQHAITVDHLSKAYRIGLKEEKEDTFFSALAASLTSPFRNYRKLRNLGRISSADEDRDVFWALRDISFQVEHGDTLAVIGKNGAGKSTLLKILSQITEPTSGKITINGKVASLLEVGTGFNAELTGRENIYLNGTILGMRRKEIESVFDAIVDFSGVEKFIDTPIKRYSSGMKVRLAFAVAAHLQPEILIIDEVLAVGDAEFQKKCLGKMDEVAKDGRTVLFVSHNMTAVKSLCAKAILLENGRIVDSGETGQVVNTYLSKVSLDVTEKSWSSPEEAPGNDQVRIKSVRLLSDDVDNRVTITTPFRIRIEFWNFADSGQMNIVLPFYTVSGEHIFSVSSEAMRVSKGIVAAECSIPGNFLNDGVYAINASIVKDSKPLFKIEDILSFEVHDERDSWFGKWPGLIRPTFIPFSLSQMEPNGQGEK